jgi:hypothetical protein
LSHASATIIGGATANANKYAPRAYVESRAYQIASATCGGAARATLCKWDE